RLSAVVHEVHHAVTTQVCFMCVATLACTSFRPFELAPRPGVLLGRSPATSAVARSPESNGQGSGVLAARLHHDGLKVEEIETPSPDSGEVLVRVHAAAITRDELSWPVDRLPAIPSYELSGVVVASGDEVYALTPFDRDGVAAEYAVVPADVLVPKPT